MKNKIAIDPDMFVIAMDSLAHYCEALEIAVREAYTQGWSPQDISDLEEQYNVVCEILLQFNTAMGTPGIPSSSTIH